MPNNKKPMLEFPKETRKPHHRGFYSAEGKKKFTLYAGLLAVGFFFIQFVAPYLFMLLTMGAVMEDGFENLVAPDARTGVYWRDTLWYLSAPDKSPFKKSNNTKVFRYDFAQAGESSEPEQVAKLDAPNPWLLPGDDSLWFVSSTLTAKYAQEQFSIISRAPLYGEITRPFMYQGAPAVLETQPNGVSLRVLAGDEWKEHERLPWLACPGNCDFYDLFQVVSHKGELHLFWKYEDNIYYRKGLPREPDNSAGDWELAAPVWDEPWQGALIDGRPALLRRIWRDDAGTVEILTQNGEAWDVFYSNKNWIWSNQKISIAPQGGAGSFLLLSSGRDLYLNVLEYRSNAKPLQWKLGDDFPLPVGMFAPMLVMYGMMFLGPVVILVVLSWLMGKYRTPAHQVEGAALAYASLNKRAVAGIVDSLVFFLCIGVLGALLVHSLGEGFFSPGGAGPENPAQVFSAIGALFGWFFGGAALLMLIFSFMEGKWGLTPGKWLLGLRVLRAENLYYCGFVAGLIRNLLRIVDGFFSYMPGILAVALSEKHQRLGDMAAGTVVVDIRRPAKQDPAQSAPEEEKRSG